MGKEAQNAASDGLAEVFHDMSLHTDPERLAEFASAFADDLVVEDRRKLTGFPQLDKAGFIEHVISFSQEMGVVARTPEVLEVRGDRLVLSRFEERYEDGSVREYLNLVCLNEDRSQCQRSVLFETDDIEAAISALDQMHAEIRS